MSSFVCSFVRLFGCSCIRLCLSVSAGTECHGDRNHLTCYRSNNPDTIFFVAQNSSESVSKHTHTLEHIPRFYFSKKYENKTFDSNKIFLICVMMNYMYIFLLKVCLSNIWILKIGVYSLNMHFAYKTGMNWIMKWKDKRNTNTNINNCRPPWVDQICFFFTFRMFAMHSYYLSCPNAFEIYMLSSIGSTSIWWDTFYNEHTL